MLAASGSIGLRSDQESPSVPVGQARSSATDLGSWWPVGQFRTHFGGQLGVCAPPRGAIETSWKRFGADLECLKGSSASHSGEFLGVAAPR